MNNKNSFLLRNSENNRSKEIKLNHYRAIFVDFLPATNTKGHRIALRDTRYKKSKSFFY